MEKKYYWYMFTDKELLAIGEGFYDRSNYTYALELFTELIQRNPENSLAYYRRGLCLQGLNRPGESEADLNKACELNPYDIDILQYMARKAADEKNYVRLREIMVYIPVENVSEREFMQHYFAELFYSAGEYETAYRLSEGRHSWMIWRCLMGMGEYIQAKKYLEGVLRLDESDLEALAAMGEVHYHLGEYDEALIRLLYEDVRYDQMDANYYHILGLVQLNLNLIDEAIDSLETAIKIDASFLLAYKNLAIAHEQNDNRKKALEYLKKAQALRYAEWYDDDVDRLLNLYDRN